jgi:ABC-type multidrug transport system ATPase subunit
LVDLQNIRFSYSSAAPTLDRVTFTIGPGLTLLLGPNGAGKSTLLKILAGVEKPDSGIVKINGFDLWKDEVAARRSLAYVPEYPDLTPYATIEDVIKLVCRLRSEPLDAGIRALTRAGISYAGNRSIRELSMGQRRRAVVAAAWIGNPKIILLDEPLESMDRAIRTTILSWIDGLAMTDAAVVIATHQVEPFVEKANRIVRVRNSACVLFEPLPADLGERRLLIERSL